MAELANTHVDFSTCKQKKILVAMQISNSKCVSSATQNLSNVQYNRTAFQVRLPSKISLELSYLLDRLNLLGILH